SFQSFISSQRNLLSLCFYLFCNLGPAQGVGGCGGDRGGWRHSFCLRKDAHSDKAYGAAVAAVMGKAKILNLVVVQHAVVTAQDFSTANSMHEIGKRLLQSVGFSEPDDVSIQAAIEANDAFIKRLEAIRNSAQGLTIGQDG